MGDLERYLQTGDARDLPPLQPAVLPARPGEDAAATARLAVLRWYRYTHLPGVAGLQEYRAAVQLAALLDGVPQGAPELPVGLRPYAGGGRGRRARRGTGGQRPGEARSGGSVGGRFRRGVRRGVGAGAGAGASAGAGAEAGVLGPARIDELLFLMERFERHGDLAALETARGLQERWLREDATSPRERAALLTDRARLLLAVGDMGAHGSWLGEAERCAGLAAEHSARQPGDDEPHMANRLLLQGRCAAASHPADRGGLERAVYAVRRGAEAARQRTPAHLHHAAELTDLLTRWYEATGAPEALREALTAARDLVRATPPEHRGLADHRDALEALRAKAAPVLGAHVVDTLLRPALSDPAASGPAVSGPAAAPATTALATTGAATTGAAPTRTPASAPDPRFAVWWRTAENTHAPSADQRAAALALVEAVPPGDPDRPAVLLLAAETELEHWMRGSDEASPARAREWALQAADAARPGHPLAGPALTALAESTLHTAANPSPGAGTTSVEQLADDAIAATRRAAEALPADDPDTPRRLERLADVMMGAADVLNDATVVTESIDLRRRAAALTPEDDPFRPFRLSNLAHALATGARSERSAALAEEGLAVARQAADALPQDHPRKHELLLNLASHLIATRGEGDQALRRLAEAERLYRFGLTRLPPGHRDHPRFTSSVSQVLQLRYDETGDRSTLDEAVVLAREAVAETHADDEHRTSRLILLARALTARHELSTADGAPDADLRAEALDAWDAVAADPRLPDRKRFEADERRAELAAAGDDPERALDALAASLARIPRLSRRSLTGPVRVAATWRGAQLAAGAAVAAIDAGHPDRAVELLEEGRAILYRQAMAAGRLRTLLRETDPDAARRLAEIDEELSSADVYGNVSAIVTRTRVERGFGRAPKVTEQSVDPRPGHAARTRRLAAERERILDGLAHDPRAAASGPGPEPGLSELRAATAGCTVVFVLAHRTRGDALLIPADPEQPVEHIPLPGLTEAAVERRTALLEAAVGDATDPEVGPDRREAAQSDLHEVLAWLWDEVAEPVLSRLPGASPAPDAVQGHGGGAAQAGRGDAVRGGYGDAAQAGRGDAVEGGYGDAARKPRLWWCPVGPVVRLPLHAAGRHPRDADDGPRPPFASVIDRVVPSYTPTLAALAHSRRPGATPSARGGRTGGALVVAVPESGGAPPLPQARREARAVGEALPGARLLIGDDADSATVEAALPHHAVVHFACHGDRDPAFGFLMGGRLHLAGGETLSAARVQEIPLERGALAFLSACSTAEAVPDLPDEPMHLAAAFQLAGFRDVIGTLWRSPDTPRMAGAIYRLLTADGARPPDTTACARALNDAQLTVRDAFPATPTRWAAYLHTGA